MQSQQLATEIIQQLPKASIAALIASLTIGQINPAVAAEFYQPPAEANTTTQTVRTHTPLPVKDQCNSTVLSSELDPCYPPHPGHFQDLVLQ